MSRATGIKSPAVLARESRRSGREDLGRTPATDYNSGPTTTTGGGWRAEHGLGLDGFVSGREYVGLEGVQLALDALDDEIVPTDVHHAFYGVDHQLVGAVTVRVVRARRRTGFAERLVPRGVQPFGPFAVVGAAGRGHLERLDHNGLFTVEGHVISKAARTRAACGVWSFLVLGVKAEPNDDEAGGGEKSGDCVHESLSSNEVAKARSNACHNISSNSNEAKGHGEDLAEGVHSGHLGGLALGGHQLLQRLPQRVPRLLGFAARQVTDRRLSAAALLCNHSLTKATFLER